MLEDRLVYITAASGSINISLLLTETSYTSTTH
jgi:hypothetical protein